MSLAVIHRNHVELLGRLSAPAAERVLSSGETVVSWRVVVQRPPDPHKPTVAVDSIECIARTSALGRRALAWGTGDTLQLTGALRRRFWRSREGVRNRYEVEIGSARRVARARPDQESESSSA
jgi:single-strand DNA-binding protein